MNRRSLRKRLGIAAGFAAVTLARAGSVGDLRWQIEERNFPSVFAAWSLADNLGAETPTDNLARHDLAIEVPELFGLKWNNRYPGLADGFDQQTLPLARSRRESLRKRNPHLVVLAEIRYRDASERYLPEDSAWWQRHGDVRIAGWAEGHFYLLDFARRDFRTQVAKQGQAAMATGAFDGVFLDWWTEDDDRVALLQAVRAALGDRALILINTNDHTAPRSAALVNGLYMECTRTSTPRDWTGISQTLRWAEVALRPPRINCVETWYHRSRQELGLMRATTTLALTQSDGYCLFGDPDWLPSPDHLHDWYGFWNKSLGRPTAPGFQRPDGAWQREFQAGTAIYNPNGNPEVSVTFSNPRRQLSTGKVGSSFQMPRCDGDLFLIR